MVQWVIIGEAGYRTPAELFANLPATSLPPRLMSVIVSSPLQGWRVANFHFSVKLDFQQLWLDLVPDISVLRKTEFYLPPKTSLPSSWTNKAANPTFTSDIVPAPPATIYMPQASPIDIERDSVCLLNVFFPLTSCKLESAVSEDISPMIVDARKYTERLQRHTR